MNITIPANFKTIMVALGVTIASFTSVASLAASYDDYYRLDDYTKWVKANKALLAKAVKAVEDDDALFSIRYDEDTGLSSSAGHGSPSKLYSGKDAALFESVLESQFANMIIKKKNAVGFLVPEKFSCGYRHCAVEVFFSESKPDIVGCVDHALMAEKGKCVFSLEDNWYLQYYWRTN